MLGMVATQSRPLTLALARHGLVILLIASVALNLSLSQELRASRRKSEAGPLAGTIVPAVRGVTKQGVVSTVQFDSNVPTVFYYFSAACGWCERNWANVEALLKQSRGRYRIVGVAASAEIPTALNGSRLSLPYLTSVDPDTLAAYGFRSTPQTVVVGQDGRVLKSWTGAYQGAQAQDVARYFDVKLPGLLPKDK